MEGNLRMQTKNQESTGLKFKTQRSGISWWSSG